MKNTIMSLKIELISRNADGKKVLLDLIDDLEGSKVVINTHANNVFINECIGGSITYLSEADGFEENVLLNNDEYKIAYQFMVSNNKSFVFGDLIELKLDDNYIQFVVLKIVNHVFLHNGIMNTTIGHEYNFEEIEELQRFLEEKHPEYKVYTHI